jgi:choline monooxygenase
MYSVDPDIARAATLPGAFYSDEAAFAAMRERVFARTWQWLGPLDDVASPGTLSPEDAPAGLPGGAAAPRAGRP